MKQNPPSCIKYVDGEINCIYCNGSCTKNGRAYGKQRYKCKGCNRSFVSYYTYHACKKDLNQKITSLICEGMSIRGISRIEHISTTTILTRIVYIAQKISPPTITLGKEYEVDELCTYVGNKTNKTWIAYAIERESRQVAGFSIGKRTHKTLRYTTDILVLSQAKKIYTDKLPHYKALIPESIHITKQYGINHIERKNLSIRTHLKRFSRRTICFNRSAKIMSAVLKIYFWE